MLKSLQAQNANMVSRESRVVIRADLMNALSSGVGIFVVGFSEFTVVKKSHISRGGTMFFVF